MTRAFALLLVCGIASIGLALVLAWLGHSLSLTFICLITVCTAADILLGWIQAVPWIAAAAKTGSPS